MLKKIVSLFCLTALLLTGGILATQPLTVNAAGVKGNIKSDTTSIDKEIDEAGGKTIETIRGIAIVVVVVLILWIGFSLFFSGSVQALVNMKYRLGSLIIALLLAFKTEAVVGFLFGIFNIQLK